MTRAAEDRRLRDLRPEKPHVDPWRPLAVVEESERGADGRSERGLTVFLAGRECPFTCIYCDLWRQTLDVPTPEGATVAQLEIALAEAPVAGRSWIKLYNASNFFDRRSVPAVDRARLVDLLQPFDRVIVECHPRMVGDDCVEFADALSGTLEVAMGLETVHPEVLSRLNKRMDLDLFAAACERLVRAGAAVRAFVLVGTPWTASEEVVEWAVRSVEWAADHGVGTVILIPMRGGNGEMERLERLGDWRPPTLRQLEEALDRALRLARSTVVLADLWDLERLAACEACRRSRRRRLERLNRFGEAEPPLVCGVCSVAAGEERPPSQGSD